MGILKKLFFFFYILFLAQISNGQSDNRYLRNIPAFGVVKLISGFGASYYMGDMTDGLNIKNIRTHFALGANYRVHERIALRAEFRYYGIKGTQEGTRVWYNNLSFRSDNFDGYLGAQVELFKFSSQRFFNAYLFGGVGLTYINPKANYQGVWYSLAPLHTENVSYSRIPFFYLGGIGFTYKLNDKWSVGMELCDNFSTSDYLDDVSTTYPLRDGMSPLAAALSDRRPELGQPANDAGNQRGNPKVKDSYGFLAFRAEYLLGSRFRHNEQKKLKCLKF